MASEPALPGSEPAGSLTVYAAASLTGAFDELATMFEERHPSVDVRPVVYDGSSTLATQIVEGAPADVFASADERTMARVVEEGLAADPLIFATNSLVIVVPAGNPAGVSGLQDFADPAATIVLCAVEVPCGAASAVRRIGAVGNYPCDGRCEARRWVSWRRCLTSGRMRG